MLCKVAQVFRARGVRPIVLLESPFSLASSPGYSQIVIAAVENDFLHGCEIKSGSGLGTRLLSLREGKHDKVCAHTLFLWSVLLLVLVIPSLSLYQRCISDLLDRQLSAGVCIFYTYVSLGHSKRVEYALH